MLQFCYVQGRHSSQSRKREKVISTNFLLIFFDEVIYPSIQQTQMLIGLEKTATN